MTKKKILLFEGGFSNVGSAYGALRKIGLEVELSSDPECLNDRTFSHLFLPGVSAFDTYVDSLKETGFYEILKNFPSVEHLKIIGICSGAQVLFEASEEGKGVGLGFLEGEVKKIKSKCDIILPHLGWNNIELKNQKLEKWSESIFGKRFYFCHSYRFPETTDMIATANYGEKFPVIVKKGNVTAIQFHPEKSFEQGLNLLKLEIIGHI